MAQRINPFHDLYLTEAIGPERFVKLFSPKFVSHATALFQPGHVVLRGLQGSGKTMLLNLLRPEVRIAYHEAGEGFPVGSEMGRFISAGINLRKSGLMDFGHLVLPESDQKFVQRLVLHYGDFLNYWIIADLLNTISTYWEYGKNDLLNLVGINIGDRLRDEFAVGVAADPCWFGYLDGIRTFAELQQRVRERIVIYRKYINLNLESDELPLSISETKTVIGDPIARLAEALRTHRILAPDVQVFIRIDQYEQLPTLNTGTHPFGTLCQEITHKALAARDIRVSYRLGTRQHAWPDPPRIFGTNDTLEIRRDYSIVDIDEKLRRKENPRTWIFPEFAVDIFKRRLEQTRYASQAKDDRILELVFGNPLPGDEIARHYVRTKESRISALQLGADTPIPWKRFIEDLAADDPLAAKFGDAWTRQKDIAKRTIIQSPPQGGKYPWDAKPYWKKERSEQALMQIASANKQQLIWCGKDDVLGLSGGNILVFLYICQHIWDAWLRDTRDDQGIADSDLPVIIPEVQSQGILEASEGWLKKQLEGEDSSRRQRFLRTIGQYFYRKLTDDKAMSYPGWNGFSLNMEELEQTPSVNNFLKTCVNYGDLYDAPHTSKHKGEKRVKYYLAPILCPYFKLPYRHTKEPEYLRTKKIAEWMTFEPLRKRSDNELQVQPDFFGHDESR